MTRRLMLALLSMLLAVTACGRAPSQDPSTVTIEVAAPVRLETAFPQIGTAFTRSHPGIKVNFRFNKVDVLVRGIKLGVPTDVFAGSGDEFAQELWRAKKIASYRDFCASDLIVITPRDNPVVRSTRDLTKAVRISIASPTSVTGPFTRKVLDNLDKLWGTGYSAAIMKNVVSTEDDPKAIAFKVESGEADAGFVFSTDAIPYEVNRISLPPASHPAAGFPVAVVNGSAHADAARQFIDFLLTPHSQRILKKAGFGPPPPQDS